MSRAFCVPAVFLLFCALVLSIITSVSLPFLPGVDIARSHVTNAAVQGTQGLTEIRVSLVAFTKPSSLILSSPGQFGIW